MKVPPPESGPRRRNTSYGAEHPEHAGDNLMKSLLFDVWLAIFSFMSVKDILSLSSTCKELHNFMSERSIWDQCLRDILSIIPVPRINRDFFSMSSSDLKYEAMKLARRDSDWPQGLIDAKFVNRFPCKELDVQRVLLLPGADWVLLLLHDGGLHLHRFSDLTEPPLCSAPGYAKALLPNTDYQADINLSVSSLGGIRVFVPESYYENGIHYGGVRVCDIHTIDPSCPCINLVATEKRQRVRAPDVSALADLIVAGWYNDTEGPESYFIEVRTIGAASSESTPNVLLNILIPDISHLDYHPPSISLLSRVSLLLATRVGLYMFSIPVMQPASQTPAGAIPTPPVWSYKFPESDTTSRQLSPVVGIDGIHSHSDNNRAIAVMTNRRLLLLSLAADPIETTVRPYPMQWLALRKSLGQPHRSIMGFRRAIFASIARKPNKTPTIVLKSCAYVTCPGGPNDDSLLRLGESGWQEPELRPNIEIPFSAGDDLVTGWRGVENPTVLYAL